MIFPIREKHKLNLDISNGIKKRLVYKSLNVLDPKIWKSLPYHIKSSKNLVFKFVQDVG